METIPDRHVKNKHKITGQKCLIKWQNIINMQHLIKLITRDRIGTMCMIAREALSKSITQTMKKLSTKLNIN